MRSTPLLLGGALLFWGYRTDALIPAITMALIVESPALFRWRLDFKPSDFFRIADLTSILFATSTIFCFTRYGVLGIYVVVKWLPYCLILPVIAQRISLADRTPLGALYFRLRKAPASAGTFDWTPAYILACLMAASIGGSDSLPYFLGTVLLLAATLYRNRPGSYPQPVVIALLINAGVFGYVAYGGLRIMQRQIESVALDLLNPYFRYQWNPDVSITAIGTIGRLKLSDAIEVRVHAKHLPLSPFLLQEASYNDFNNGIWSVRQGKFTAIDSDRGQHQWTLAPDSDPAYLVAISVRHRKPVSVVPLPLGVTRISGDEIVEVQRNPMDTYMLEMPPGQARYQARFAPNHGHLAVPAPEDLEIATNYRPTIERLAQQLRLAELTHGQSITALKTFFATNFRYALGLPGTATWRKPLTDFLLQHREGHCEYFATATVLLLRAAGIPTRYSVGYLIQEYSGLERAWIGRARHRHAWASAFVDGRWQIVDTTPAIWFDIDAESAPRAQWLFDTFAWLQYRIKRFGRGSGDGEVSGLLWLTPFLAAILVWRLYARGLIRRRPHDVTASGDTQYRGRDSAFYALIEYYKREGTTFQPGETVAVWAHRILPRLPEMRRALDLHYRSRFAAADLSESDQHRLGQLVRKLQSRDRH